MRAGQTRGRRRTVGGSMALSWPSGDDLMGGPRPRCTPAAPAPSGGYGPSGPPGVIWIFPPKLHHLFSTICQPEIYRTDICWTDICRPDICPTDICRPDELAAIALSFAAFDNREPERAEMGAERPISASVFKSWLILSLHCPERWQMVWVYVYALDTIMAWWMQHLLVL